MHYVCARWCTQSKILKSSFDHVRRTVRWKTNVSSLKRSLFFTLPVSWEVEAVDSRPKARRRNIVLDQNLPYQISLIECDRYGGLQRLGKGLETNGRSIIWFRLLRELLLGAARYLLEYVGLHERWSERFALANTRTSRFTCSLVYL